MIRDVQYIIFPHRKLTLFDDWSSLAVYVSMDNTVVIEDISECSVIFLIKNWFRAYTTVMMTLLLSLSHQQRSSVIRKRGPVGVSVVGSKFLPRASPHHDMSWQAARSSARLRAPSPIPNSIPSIPWTGGLCCCLSHSAWASTASTPSTSRLWKYAEIQFSSPSTQNSRSSVYCVLN